MIEEERELVDLSREEAARILAAGAAAASRGRKVTACPYSPAGDATERVKAAAWIRGYLSAAGQ